MNTPARLRTIATTLIADNDLTTVEGRGAERQRRVVLSALSSALTQVVMTGVSFLMVPIALEHLGGERYGLWITLTSILAMFGFADLGLGNGLVNAIGEAHGRDDENLAAGYISTGFFMLTGIAALLAIVGLLTWRSFSPDWRSLFNLQSHLAETEAATTVGVIFISFLLALPLSIANRIRMGYQEGYINGFFGAIGSVLGLVGVVIAVSLDGGLPWIAGIVIAAPLVANLLNAAFLLREKSWALPRWSRAEADKSKELLRLGVLFFVLQLAMAIGFFSDNLVIARVLGPEAVTTYAVPYKLFGLVPVALGFVLIPLWPAYREASTRGDRAWVTRTMTRSMKLGLGFALPVAVILILTGRIIVDQWTDGAVEPSMWLLVGLGLFVVANGISTPLAMFYNGLNILGYQVVTGLSMAVLNILVSIALVDRYGVHGAIFGTVIAQVLCTFLPAAIYVPRFLARLGDTEA